MAVLAGMGVYSGAIYTYVDHGSVATDQLARTIG
jgi:hypothetical protein